MNKAFLSVGLSQSLAILPPIHKMHLGFTLHDSCMVSNHFVFVFLFLNTKLHNLVKAKGKCYIICAKKQVPVPYT